MDTYSTYEAKARFSEILRKVRAGRRVVVTHHGKLVAEIRPVDKEPQDLAARLEDLEKDGNIVRATTDRRLRVVERRRGALARFIRARD